MPAPPVCVHRQLFAFASTLLLALFFAGHAVAQPEDETTPPEKPADRTIFVPFKDLSEALKKHAATAIVPYDEYLRFLNRNQTPAGKPAEAVISQAAYTVTIEESQARIEAVFTINVLGQPWVELPLNFGEAAIGKLEGSHDQVLLRGTGEGTYALMLGEAGEQTVTLELISRVRTSPDGREFTLAIPTVGISTLSLTIPEADQTVAITPNLVVVPTADAPADTTSVTANLGATRSITARWHPKTSTRPEMDLLATVSNYQLVTIEGGYVHHDAWLTFDVLRGDLSTVRIAAPPGQRVLDVSSNVGVKGWQVQEDVGRQTITVDLLNAVEKTVTIEVHTERLQGDMNDAIAGIGAGEQTFGIHALDVVRENGQVAIRVADGLDLTVNEQQGLTRISSGDVDPRLKPGQATAFRFYSPQFRLAVSARPIEPRIIVSSDNHVAFSEDELRLQSELSYSIERAGVFELRIRVPENLTIDAVNSSHPIVDSFDEATRLLTIRLQESTLGELEVNVVARRPLPSATGGAEPVEQDLPVLEPLDVTRETGTLWVSAPAGIEVVTNPASVQSAQPLPLDQFPRGAGSKLRSAWTFSRRPVRVPVTTTRKPTRLSANVATTIDVQPEVLDVTSTVTYQVEFAGIDTVQILVPETVSSTVQIEAIKETTDAADIKQKTPGEAVNGSVPWTIVMQRKVEGPLKLRISYRLSRTGEAITAASSPVVPAPAAAGSESAVQLPLIRVAGQPAAGESTPAVPLSQLKGEIRVTKERSLSVTSEASGGDVESIDLRELTLLPQEGAIAYRYYRQPEEGSVAVSLTQTKHDIQEVTPTVIEHGLVEIAALPNSAAAFRCRYFVKTSLRQQLRVDLPKDLELLGVFVDGHEEKLNLLSPEEAGSLPENVAAYSVNISRRQSPDQAFLLTIQFNWTVNPSPFEAPFGRGEIQFPLPRIGVARTGSTLQSAPIQQFRADVYVPKSFWLVGSPERFTILGERDWWDGLLGRPQAIDAGTDPKFSAATSSPLDFPTTGLVSKQYQNLGGADVLEVIWWDTVKMTTLLSLALALIAFILLKTSWENKLGILLLISFFALLFGVRDRDALAHGLAAARIGLAFLVGLWVIHALFARHAVTPAVADGPEVTPSTSATGRPPASGAS